MTQGQGQGHTMRTITITFVTVQTNTYQAVLTTDGSVSFVMFNYATLTWTTGLLAGGHITTGLGGKPAVVITTITARHQWRRQDLLRGGAKLENRSWGTNGELQGRVQQLLDD